MGVWGQSPQVRWVFRVGLGSVMIKLDPTKISSLGPYILKYKDPLEQKIQNEAEIYGPLLKYKDPLEQKIQNEAEIYGPLLKFLVTS